jgi:hypothetical protein
MKSHTLLLVGLLVLVALFVGWSVGRDYSRIAASTETNASRVSDHESRLLPLERDLERREKRWAKTKGLFDWMRGKIGL